MGLIKKIFGDKQGRGESDSSRFQESDPTTEQASKNAPRRELVQVVLRDTMRRHGIPSDWIECRILSVVSQSSAVGMHVTLVVRQGHDRLLAYVPAFQTSYRHAIEVFEPKSTDWLLSLSWQFEGMTSQAQMPEPGSWSGAAPATAAAAAAAAAVPTQPQGLVGVDEELEEDLKALYAIRDAALAQDPGRSDGPPDFEHTQPQL